MKPQSGYWIGIDLGTYNSSAAIRSQDGNVDIIRSTNGKLSDNIAYNSYLERCKEFPSFISFNKDGIIDDIGFSSKEKAYSDPEYTVWGIKRLLGKTYSELKESGELDRYPFRIKPDRNNGQCLIAVGDKVYSPVHLCTEIFKKIKSETESQINCIVDSAVVSVPAYFDPVRITPIVEAAKSAGFNNVKSIPEPVAAALAYDIEITVRPVKTLVFDLGAGTLDVTAGYLYRHPNQPGEYMFQVLKTTGDSKLGGIDIDDRLIEYIKRKCEIEHISKTDQSVIRRVAEISKIRLSEELDIEQDFNINGNKYKFSMNQFDLKVLLESGSGTEKNLLEECRRQIMSAINEIGWHTQEIENLILIGGPTKLKCIYEIFSIVFHGNPAILGQLESFYSGQEQVDRMTAVSMGAALSINRKANDIVPHGHGVEDLNITDEILIYRPNIMLPCDSPYPFQSKPFLINWMNLSGLYEFKIIQHVPKSETDQFGFEYRFIGILKFAVRNPYMSMVVIQMGYNANKELVVSIINALMPSEFATYVGINNYVCIGMNYPLSVKRPHHIGNNKIRKLEPTSEILDKFRKWSQVITVLFKKKLDDYPIPQMHIQQILDEVNTILAKTNIETQYESLYTKINNLLWNSCSKGLINLNEFNDLNAKLREFENNLFKISDFENDFFGISNN